MLVDLQADSGSTVIIYPSATQNFQNKSCQMSIWGIFYKSRVKSFTSIVVFLHPVEGQSETQTSGLFSKSEKT